VESAAMAIEFTPPMTRVTRRSIWAASPTVS
jgi:hypothetical protein